MKTLGKLATALVGSAIVGTGILYATRPVEIRAVVMDKIYQSLPADTQRLYLENKVMNEDYGTMSGIVKDAVGNGMLNTEDNVYVGVSSLEMVPSDLRAASLQMILDNSEYNVQKAVTMYGIPKLTGDDAANAALASGKTIWDQFAQKVTDAYNNMFK